MLVETVPVLGYIIEVCVLHVTKHTGTVGNSTTSIQLVLVQRKKKRSKYLEL